MTRRKKPLQNSTKIEKSQSTKNKKSSKLKKLFDLKRLTLVAVLFLIVGILGAGVLVATLYFSQRGKEEKDTIKVEGVSEEVVEQIKKQFVYTSDSTDREYYSPILDITFNYNPQVYRLSEDLDYVSIVPKNFSFTEFSQAKLKLSDKKGIKIKQKILSEYDFNQNLEVTQDEKQENIRRIDFSYSFTSFVDEQKIARNHTLLIKEMEEKYVYFDVMFEAGNRDEKMISDMTQLLNTVNLNPENVDQEIIVDIEGAQVAVNKKLWQVVSQFENSFYLAQIINRDEVEEKYKFATNTISLTINPYLGEDVEATVIDRLNLYIDNYQDEDEFQIFEKEETAKLDGIDFKYTKFKYRNYKEDDFLKVVKVYVGHFNGNLAVITTIGNEGDDVSSKETEVVLNSINFENAESESVSLVNNSNKNILGDTSIEIQKAAILGKPATVQIFNRSCIDLSVANIKDAPTISNNTYNLCGAGRGSGVIVNDEGYVVTNAHVAYMSEFDVGISVLSGASYDPDGFINDFVLDGNKILLKQYPNIVIGSDQYKNAMTNLMLNFVSNGYWEGYIDFDQTSNENFVQNDNPFAVNLNDYSLQNKSKQLSTKIIDKYNTTIYKSQIDENTSMTDEPDLAILKIEESGSYPSVEVANYETLNVGNKVTVIGFPGSANSEELFGSTASMIPTITTGTISALKPSGSGDFKLIQMDASISGGNSGGPVLNNNGNLIGISTYTINPSKKESADFNVAVSVEEVSKFLNKNSIETKTGKVTMIVKEGLDDFSQDYYKLAKEKFESAIKSSSHYEDVLSPLILVADEKISNGEDKSPKVEMGGFDLDGTALIVGGCIVCLISLGSLLLLVITILKKKQKGNRNSNVTQPPQSGRGGTTSNIRNVSNQKVQSSKKQPVHSHTKAKGKNATSSENNDNMQGRMNNQQQVKNQNPQVGQVADMANSQQAHQNQMNGTNVVDVNNADNVNENVVQKVPLKPAQPVQSNEKPQQTEAPNSQPAQKSQEQKVKTDQVSQVQTNYSNQPVVKEEKGINFLDDKPQQKSSNKNVAQGHKDPSTNVGSEQNNQQLGVGRNDVSNRSGQQVNDNYQSNQLSNNNNKKDGNNTDPAMPHEVPGNVQ